MLVNLKIIIALALVISGFPGLINAQDSLSARQVEGYFQIAITGVLTHSTNIDTLYWKMSEDDSDYCNASHISVDMATATSHILHLKYFSTCFIETGRDDCRGGIIVSAKYLHLIHDHMKSYNLDLRHDALKTACSKAIEYIEMTLGHIKSFFPQIDFSEFDKSDAEK